MLAKMTSKNQITIPQKIVGQISDAKYFEVEHKDGLIVLKPLHLYETDLEKIRSKIKGIGLKPDCVREAVKWARSKGCRWLSIPTFFIRLIFDGTPGKLIPLWKSGKIQPHITSDFVYKSLRISIHNRASPATAFLSR